MAQKRFNATGKFLSTARLRVAHAGDSAAWSAVAFAASGLLAQLKSPKVGTDPAVRELLRMDAALHDATVFEHNNFVGIDDRGQTRCNDPPCENLVLVQ